MASSGEAPELQENLEKEEKGGDIDADKEEKDDSPEKRGDSSVAEEDGEKTLPQADELMENGSKALKTGDYAEAVDCFSRAVEIRVAHYGELAPECASAYYKYGCALLYKAQEEADPLGSVPKKEPVSTANSVSDGAVKSGDNGEGSSASVTCDAKQDDDSCNNDEPEEGADDKNQENDNEESDDDDDDDLAEADEDESDLDLAWKMLDVARAIVEKQPGDTMEKVDILAALGEVSLEREDIETSLSDYQKALSMLEHLVEPDSRRIAELNFRICLVLEVGSKVEDAVPYCQKAISVCKDRLQRLMAEINGSTASVTTVDASSVINARQNGKQPTDGSQFDSSISEKEEEIETLNGLSCELEKKLEDLGQVIHNPKSLLSEVLKMVSSKSAGSKMSISSTEGRASFSERLNSSQKGVITGGFDSPTVSTAATNGNVMHLGVVGRGVKRATVNPISAEPSPKKLASESSVEKESSISEG